MAQTCRALPCGVNSSCISNPSGSNTHKSPYLCEYSDLQRNLTWYFGAFNLKDNIFGPYANHQRDLS